MSRKTRAGRAQAENLCKVTRRATVEEVLDEESIPAAFQHTESHDMSNLQACHNADIDLELLDIIGALRGTPVVDDEDESSESGSEDDELGEVPEIQEISVLEQFLSTLQKAHDLALAAEREQEKGQKRPRQYNGKSMRTKQRFRQTGWELAEKGFCSVKEWLLKTAPAPIIHYPEIAPDMIASL